METILADTAAGDFLPAAPIIVERSAAIRNSPKEPLASPIFLEGALTPEELKSCRKMVVRTILPLKQYFIFAAEIFLFLAIVIVWGGSLLFVFQTEIHLAILIFSLSMALSFLAIVALFRTAKRNIKRTIRNGEGVYSHAKTIIYEDCYLYYSDQEFAEVKWQAFSKFQLSDKFIILYFEGFKIFKIFTRHTFQTNEDWDGFIGLLERKMPRC